MVQVSVVAALKAWVVDKQEVAAPDAVPAAGRFAGVGAGVAVVDVSIVAGFVERIAWLEVRSHERVAAARRLALGRAGVVVAAVLVPGLLLLKAEPSETV